MDRYQMFLLWKYLSVQYSYRGSSQMNIPLITPEPPDPIKEEARTFWRELGKDLIRKSIDPINEAAKQIIAVTGILEGLYFNAITFSNLRGKAPSGWYL